MPNRAPHVAKSLDQRSAYARYIKSLDYDPTVDESLEFDSTENAVEELGESRGTRPGEKSSKGAISAHFRSHWIEWIIAAMVIIGLYLINESRVTISILGKSVEENTDSIKDIQTDVRDLTKRTNDSELEIVGNSKDIEYLKSRK